MITSEAALVVLEVPLAEEDAGVAVHHLDAQLTTPQARVLRRLRVRLERDGATVGGGKNPRKVSSTQDAVRWLLERVIEADAATEPTLATEGTEGSE